MIAERSVTVDGLTLRYLTGGSGPALVLLHGLGDSAVDWCRALPALTESYTVYAPDLPGFAGDGVQPPDYAPATLARYVVAFLDELGIERAGLVGSSLGGQVALHVALNQPERVSALALVGSAGLGRAVSPALSLLTLPVLGDLAIAWAGTPLGTLQRAWLRAGLLFARPYRTPNEWLAEQYRLGQRPGFLPATLAALRAQVSPLGQREVLRDQLTQLTLPVLLIWGSRDHVVPGAQAQAALARLPNARLEFIPGSSHLPHLEQPEPFVAALTSFLGELAPQP